MEKAGGGRVEFFGEDEKEEELEGEEEVEGRMEGS